MRPSFSSFLLLSLAACPSDDIDFGQLETTNSEPSTNGAAPVSTTGSGSTSNEASANAGTTQALTSGTTGAHTTQSGGGETSQAPRSCAEADCDPTTQYCHASISDAPSEFSCRSIPAECRRDPSCDCIVPRACPDSLQDCRVDGDLVIVDCVDG